MLRQESQIEANGRERPTGCWHCSGPCDRIFGAVVAGKVDVVELAVQDDFTHTIKSIISSGNSYGMSLFLSLERIESEGIRQTFPDFLSIVNPEWRQFISQALENSGIPESL